MSILIPLPVLDKKNDTFAHFNTNVAPTNEPVMWDATTNLDADGPDPVGGLRRRWVRSLRVNTLSIDPGDWTMLETT